MGDTWYLNPLRWVDDADLFDVHGEVTIHNAIETLRDKLVDNPPDTRTMARGILHSTHHYGLTRKQQSAVDLAREAMQSGMTPTMYVAEKLNINRHSAFKLLKRADERIQPKMETFREKFDISYRRARIAEKDIQRVLAGMKVDCAGVGCARRAPARTCLCFECLHKYGMEGDRLTITADWLDKLIRMARHDARKQAIEYLATA